MRERRSGTIVNVGRTAEAKGYSEALAHDLSPFNVRILVVEPGQFRARDSQHAAGTTKPYEGSPPK
ncbi:uncharacterized protein PADG_12404 [Paracoccidioides brasiliensis Pb18]|uniref:Uncharacterized protein n=1 Tax=Paracoccidioides brasiliensis (strain Pb18) TaxID=502780 RepID=A0A0A0HU54_PARBD|nr:uncharacterized protein PADG_12404 [Paracoccidioides brasiliensis Pb18]KGM91546.1 hypothetical protein PADG_12404 [Paracoccidioides brasiliensis Pb18]ODH46466.1 hypothetical protein GX48_07443 [Paracoccidioides brasiliensis]